MWNLHINLYIITCVPPLILSIYTICTFIAVWIYFIINYGSCTQWNTLLGTVQSNAASKLYLCSSYRKYKLYRGVLIDELTLYSCLFLFPGLVLNLVLGHLIFQRLGVCDLSLWHCLFCRSGSVSGHWDEIYGFVEQLTNRFVR